jgi:transposase
VRGGKMNKHKKIEESEFWFCPCCGGQLYNITALGHEIRSKICGMLRKIQIG